MKKTDASICNLLLDYGTAVNNPTGAGDWGDKF